MHTGPGGISSCPQAIFNSSNKSAGSKLKVMFETKYALFEPGKPILRGYIRHDILYMQRAFPLIGYACLQDSRGCQNVVFCLHDARPHYLNYLRASTQRNGIFLHMKKELSNGV